MAKVELLRSYCSEMSVSKADFEKKISHVMENLYHSHVHFKIHEKMTNMLNAELETGPDFLRWSHRAHREAGILCLAKAYDGGGLGILKVVNIFSSHYYHWGLNITDNANLRQEIDDDRSFLTGDSLVRALKHLRDKSIAHTDKELYPPKSEIKYADILGGELIFKENGRPTTKEIENLPLDERTEALSRLCKAMRESDNKLLGERIPRFSEYYELTTKGIEICNRYMARVGIKPLDLELKLKLEGIDW